MNKQLEYRKQIEMIEEKLIRKNKEYMERISSYMMIASIFYHQEEVVMEQLLSIYQDVFAAQQDGCSAEEFLGKDSKQMADELLSCLPPIGLMEVARLSVLILSIYLGSQFLMDFAGTGVISLNWIGLLCDTVLSLLLPIGIFLILRRLIYQTDKIKILGIYIGFPLVFLGLCFLRLWLVPKKLDFVLTGWGLVVLLALLGVALLFFQEQKLVRYVFLPTYVLTLACGSLTSYLKQVGASVPIWLNLTLIFLPIIIFWIGSMIFLMRKEK